MSPFKDPFKSSSDTPSIPEALSMLMQAVRSEGDVFLKLLALYARGGKDWQELADTVEHLHARSGGTKAPGASPGDDRDIPTPPDAPGESPAEDGDTGEPRRHG